MRETYELYIPQNGWSLLFDIARLDHTRISVAAAFAHSSALFALPAFSESCVAVLPEF